MNLASVTAAIRKSAFLKAHPSGAKWRARIGPRSNHLGREWLVWYHQYVSLAEIKNAIGKLSLEERADLAAWLHGWENDSWDEQMKRDISSGKLDSVLHEIEEDIKAGRVREMP
jgi:hypothetical protein